MMNPLTIHEQHASGVHVYCTPARTRRVGTASGVFHVRPSGAGTSDDCTRAGTVERFHAHDFDGPLPCCDDDGAW